VAQRVLALSPAAAGYLSHGLSLGWIAAAAWLAMNMTLVFEAAVARKYDIASTDNLRARKVLTQFKVFQRILVVLIGILALAAMLMTFEPVRKVGMGLLASAGVAGIVLGFSAQSTIATIFAGIQIALTQPIRIDDVVIVEGEWGRVEEITLTYVVVRIWDLRRLVVPITYFIERPFQNWTRVSADLLGTVFLYVDYTVPVSAVREELHRILKESKWWDGKVWNLQVTNATERCVELRALMSASDASTAWDLRCHVRERLLEFIQARYPEALPRFRAEIRESSAELSGGLTAPEAASPGMR
jgi:hypothetical protein